MVPRPAVERSMGSPSLLRTRLLSNLLPHISARSTGEDGVVEPFQTDGSVTLVVVLRTAKGHSVLWFSLLLSLLANCST